MNGFIDGVLHVAGKVVGEKILPKEKTSEEKVAEWDREDGYNTIHGIIPRFFGKKFVETGMQITIVIGGDIFYISKGRETGVLKISYEDGGIQWATIPPGEWNSSNIQDIVNNFHNTKYCPEYLKKQIQKTLT